MAYVKANDVVLIDEINFEKFMDYRAERGLATGWGWMHLPSGTMMEVQELIFRTTGSRRRRKTKTDENGEEKTFTRRGRSCSAAASATNSAADTPAMPTKRPARYIRTVSGT